MHERLQEGWILQGKAKVLPTREEISFNQWKTVKVRTIFFATRLHLCQDSKLTSAAFSSQITDIFVQLGLVIDNEASSSLDILVHRGSFDSFILRELVFELYSYDSAAAMEVNAIVKGGYAVSEVAARLFRMASQVRAGRRVSFSLSALFKLFSISVLAF